jgi:hypothetical protein
MVCDYIFGNFGDIKNQIEDVKVRILVKEKKKSKSRSKDRSAGRSEAKEMINKSSKRNTPTC